jgi:ABC-2 type transport system permease protein
MNSLHSLPARAPDGRLLPAVWKLLALRMRISWNGFRRARLRRKIGIVFVYALLLGFAYFVLAMSRLVLDFVQSPEFSGYAGADLNSLLASIPTLTLTGLFVGTLLTSFGVLLQALYLSGDMDFLLSTPVPIRAVFVAKFLQAVLPNFALTSLFGMPLLFGLGLSNGYHFIYFPLVVLTMVVLALAGAGLASLLVMLVVRILPPRRAAEILGFLGALIGIGCSQLANLSNLFGEQVQLSNTRLTGLLLLADTSWLPLNWAGQGLVALGQGRWLPGVLLSGATFGFAAAAFWFALVTAERWYYSGWAGMQVVARKKPVRPAAPVNAAAKGLESGLTRLLPAPVLAIVQKDFLTLRRDLRNLSQLIYPIMIGVVYTIALLRNGAEPPAGQGGAPDWFMESFRVALTYGSVGLSLFVGWMFLSRVAGMSFSQEGRNYWMLKVAPLGSSTLLAAKFLVAYIPTLGLGLVFLVLISIARAFSALEFFYSLAAIVMCLAGMAGLLLSFGAAGANFNWEDPRRMNAGFIGCLGQIVTMLYLPVSFGAFIGPLVLVEALQMPAGFGYLGGLILGTGITLACAIVPLQLVQKRVERLGEG